MLYRRPIGSLLLAAKKPRLDAFLRDLTAFGEVQAGIRARIAAQHQGSRLTTALGPVEDFPVCEYEDLRPWIERFRAGEAGSLFGPQSGIEPDGCKFVSTSGTTGSPKIIPVTASALRAQAMGWEAWGLAAFRDHRDAAFWDVLPVSSPAPDSMSGLATWTMQPASFKTLYAVPDRAQAITPFDLKLKALLRLTVGNQNLGMLMAANPSTLLFLVRLLETHGFDLVRDLRNGTFFAGSVQGSMSSTGYLARRDIRAGRRLDAILQKEGALTPRAVWPRLKLVATWLGGTLGHWCEALRPGLGHVPWRDHGLVASEGRFTVPLADGTPDGVLDPRAAFFEFLPESAPVGGLRIPLAGQLIQPCDLIPGENYRLVVTTLGGLIRYEMHDIVQCRGFFDSRNADRAPVVRFLRKTSQFANITGEKLSACQVAEAISKLASDQYHAGLRDVRMVAMAPDRSADPPCYVLYAEPAPGQDVASQPGLWNSWQDTVRSLDGILTGLNCEYRDKRASGRLGPVRVAFLRPGSLEDLRARHLAVNPTAAPDQFKQPLLLDDTTCPLRDMALRV